MYPHLAHSPTSISQPEPVGYCDRCGALFYLKDLQWMYQWAGSKLMNTRFLVCSTNNCLDTPNEQGRVIVIGPDPVPLKDIRPGFNAQQMAQGAGPYPVQSAYGWGEGQWGAGTWGLGGVATSVNFVEP